MNGFIAAQPPPNSPINGGGYSVTNLDREPPPIYGGTEGGLRRRLGDRIRGRAHFTERQRALRKESTPAERVMWEVLRNKSIDGFKFRRQHGVGSFIVDFYCNQKKLILEIDGGIHDSAEAQEYDRDRTAYLEKYGYRVLRFRNTEVFESLPEVIITIRNALHRDLELEPSPIYGGVRRGLQPRGARERVGGSRMRIDS